MCPKSSDTRNVSRQSHVGDLEGIPGLFQALTEGSDEDEDKWSTFTFPVDFEAVLLGPKGEKEYKYILRKYFFFLFQVNEPNFLELKFHFPLLDSTDQNLDTTQLKPREDIITYNCTVVYMSQCVSVNKCKRTCESMGATSFRYNIRTINKIIHINYFIILFVIESNLNLNLISYDFSDGFSMVVANALDQRASTMASMKADVRYVQKQKRKTYLTICHRMNLILAKIIWLN